uniref:Clc-like protein n=1 Tax=Haemonchus contortus TaxID=6289 RepID=A0A7I4YYX8_HAECO
MYKIVLITSIVLIVAGMLLTTFSLFSPMWQIVDRPKLAEIHHHGLWWDCVVPDGTLIPLQYEGTAQTDEQCLNKFDPLVLSHLRHILEVNDQSSKELLLHRFLPHHKAVIFFAVFTLVFGTIGIITGACSPCFPPNSLLYVVSIFMTGACSMLSDIIFIFGATKDSKTLQQITLKEEPQIQNRLGIACYLHILATSFFTLALIFSIGSAYLLISSKGRGSCCTTKKEYLQQYRWQQEAARARFSCNRNNCRPIVVVEDDIL